jgi:glutaryl-CoA dehydrogenase
MTLTPLAGDFYGLEMALSDQEKKFLANLRSYLEHEVKPHVNRLWEAAEFPQDIVAGLATCGVMGMAFPETRPFETTAVFRGWVALELARIDASVATYVGVNNGLAMGSIGELGSPEQRAEWLPPLSNGHMVGCFGLTEPLSGSDSAQGLRTTAERRGDEWVLNGEKRWIGNGTWCDVCVVWAKDLADNKVKGFIVPTSTPGYSAERIEGKISLRIVQNAHITLTNVVVPESNRLPGATSFADTAKVLRLTRAEVAWAAVGVAVGAYEAARTYALEREQFGVPIARHQLVQHHLVTALGLITSALTMVRELSAMQDRGTMGDEHAALAKAVTTINMREAVAHCREALGGNGIVLEYDVARFFADAEALYSYEGTREMNTLIVGRAVTGHAAFV